MNLPEINILLLTFRLRARDSVVLPPFLGSTLRGAFGAALKKVFCFVPHGECGRCWFYEACPYQYIFESPNLIPKQENHPLLRGQKELPQPFILIPPVPTLKRQTKEKKLQRRIINFNEDYAGNHFSRGETLEFSVLLMGKAAAFWAQVLVAVRLIAKHGLGDRRIPFVLTEAFAHDSQGKSLEIFSLETPKIASYGISTVPLARIVDLRLQSFINDFSETDSLIIELQTPTRIRIADEISPTITFFDFLKKLTERLEFLAFLYAETAQKIDYRPILEDADKIFSTQSSLKNYRYEQFSNTLGSKTRRDAVLGEIAFQDNSLAKFLPFLAAGELLNIGSNTSAGFGKFIMKQNCK